MKKSKQTTSVLVAALAVLLAGCQSDSASQLINGNDHSITVFLDQDYFWNKEYRVGLLTTHKHECMRRPELQSVPMDGFKMEVFRTLEGGYVVRERNNWYIADTVKCRLQQYKTPPLEPGEAVGSFEFKADKLTFVAAPKPPAALPQAGAQPVNLTQPTGAAPAPSSPAR